MDKTEAQGKTIKKISHYEAVGMGHKLGYTSSPKSHFREMAKTGWKKKDIEYRPIYKK